MKPRRPSTSGGRVVPQPGGTVTLLFSDIESSTRLLEAQGRDKYAAALALHREILRRAFDLHDGYEVDYEGDSFFAAFPSARAAVKAAVMAQRSLAAEHWPDGHELRVRMGIHTGEPLPAPPKYVGLDVHRAARIMEAGHGGQVLLSDRTASLVDEHLPAGVSLLDLGEHSLRDLSSGGRLHQLVIEGLANDFPPLKTLVNRATNLPAHPNRLVGRANELAAITALLSDVETRLLTLTGPGGTGKTRLALHAGAELLDEFEDGVFAAFLAPVRDPALVPSVIGQALGLREQPGETVEKTLERYLAERHILLVLDNVEHLLGAASTVSTWLTAAPRLTILATSREPLRIAAEASYDVPPLPVPQGQPASSLAALTNEAVELFVERAKAADRAFELTDKDAGAVSEICTRLDGLPLAIELAAARVRTLSPEALRSRLDAALTVLTGGARDADERQKTLEATIEWSYELLESEEKTLFRRLAPFAGGWTVSAVETACEADLDTLQSLVEKSLVRRHGERFSMLATIREYAHERLQEAAEAEEFGTRHAEFFLAVAEACGRELRSERSSEALGTLDAEIANLRAALEWFRAHHDVEREFRLVGSLERFWPTHGHVREGWAAVRRALARRPSTPTIGLLSVLRAAVWLAREIGEHDVAETWSAERIAVARELGPHTEVVDALSGLAIAKLDRRDMTGALELFEESALLARETGDLGCIAPAIGNLGQALLIAGDWKRSRELIEEALTTSRTLGDVRWVAGTLTNLGWALMAEGLAHDAEARFCEALELAYRFGGVDQECLEGLAAVAGARNDQTRSTILLGAAERLRDSDGLSLAWYEQEREQRARESARSALGAVAFEDALSDGRKLSLEEVVEFALRPVTHRAPGLGHQ